MAFSPEPSTLVLVIFSILKVISEVVLKTRANIQHAIYYKTIKYLYKTKPSLEQRVKELAIILNVYGYNFVSKCVLY